MSKRTSTGDEPLPWPEDGPRWEASFEWRFIGGRAEPVAVRVASLTGEPLTATTLRQLPFAKLVNRARALREHEAERKARAARGYQAATRAAEAIRRLAESLAEGEGEAFKRGRPRLAVDELARVAEVYAAAHAGGYRDLRGKLLGPTQAVADHFKLSHSAAAKRVHLCRELGLLAPTAKGRAGGIIETEGES